MFHSAKRITGEMSRAAFTVVLTMAGMVAITGAAQGQVVLDLIQIGDVSNPADAQGKGSISYEYLIGKYEVLNHQYAEFLNAVASTNGDPLGLWNPTSSAGWGVNRTSGSGTPGDPWVYEPEPTRVNDSTRLVSAWDALRFANWMTNGQTTDPASTETGVYTIPVAGVDYTPFTNTAGGWNPAWIPLDLPARNPGVVGYALQTEDEFIKAGYYNPVTTSYFLYPSSTDSVPSGQPPGNPGTNVGCITAPGPGCGDNLSGSTQYPNTVSPYGLQSLVGGDNELTETTENKGAFPDWPLTNGVLQKGGDWNHDFERAKRDFSFNDFPVFENAYTSFRLVYVGLTETWEWDPPGTETSGAWTGANNWNNLGNPDGPEHNAIFGDSIGSATAVVFTDEVIEVNELTFNNSMGGNYQIAGGPSLDLTGTDPSVTVSTGDNEFQLEVNVLADTDLFIDSGASLEFINRLNLNGNTLTKTGSGTLILSNSLNTGNGSLVCAEGPCIGTGNVAASLTIGAGAVFSPGSLPPAVAAAASVPEPGGLVLWLLGWWTCITARRCQTRRVG